MKTRTWRRWLIAVRDDTTLSGTAKHLAYVLDTYRAAKGVFVSTQTLAAVMRVSERTVYRARAELRKADYLDWNKGRTGVANYYLFGLPGIDTSVQTSDTGVTPITTAKEKTPPSGVVFSSRESDGSAEAPPSTSLTSFQRALIWIHNAGWDDPHADDTMRWEYGLDDSELDEALTLLTEIRERRAEASPSDGRE